MKSHVLAASMLFAIVRLDVADARFTNPDGAFPEGGVTVSGTTIFGTASSGGAHAYGTIWSFDTSTGIFTNLHDFAGGSDGIHPYGGLAVSGTVVFGTASAGGAKNSGTIWSFDTSSDTFKKLHDFFGPEGNSPLGGVAVSGKTVFGTASEAGAHGGPCTFGCGTIWSFDTSSDTFKKLHDFSAIPDGANPFGGVAVSGTTIFGTAREGGAHDCAHSIGCGTTWSFDTSSDTFTKLHDFDEVLDGHWPEGGVALSGTTVFGTAFGGGANGHGTIWSFESSSDTFTKLHDFNFFPDGTSPLGGVAVSGSTIFGTAPAGGFGGDNENGTVWSFDTSSETFTKLHDFNLVRDGSRPYGGVAVSDTTVVGTAREGGAYGDGTIWSFDTITNTFTNLYSFNVPEPSTVTLAAIGILTLLGCWTRRSMTVR